MAPVALAALISGGAGLLGSGIGSVFNASSQESANKTNLQISRENRDFYYQQWMRENAYNDPSAMMARLARAGLNPNLMYGDGASGMPASASMPAVDPGRVIAPQMDPLSMAQAANLAADTALKQGQREKVDSDIRVNEGSIKVSDSVAVYNAALTEMTKHQQDNIVAQTKALDSSVQETNSRIALNYATIENMKENTYLNSVEVSLKSKEVEALCEKYAAETGWTNEQIKYAGLLAMAQVRKLDADAAAARAGIELTQEQKKQVRVTTANLTVENRRLHWNLNQDMKYGDADRRLRQSQAISQVVSAIVTDGSIMNNNTKRRVEAFGENEKRYGLD